MSRLSRVISAGVRRTGLLRPDSPADERARLGWRAPIDDALLRRLETLALAPRRPAAGGIGGEHRSRARAASNDFVDYRPYLPGDDYRQIDWNAYGRLNQLFVKLSEARERLPLTVYLDCSASMSIGSPRKLDLARQVAAVLGYVALARYDQVELVRLGGEGPAVRPLRGKQRFAELLGQLGGLAAGGPGGLDAHLAALRPSGPVGQAVLISDMLHPDGYEQGLGALVAAGFEAAVVQVLSPEEVEPQAGGDVELLDLESEERVQVGLSPQAVATYRARLEAWCDGVARACAARGVRYRRARTDDPLERLVLVELRSAGILR